MNTNRIQFAGLVLFDWSNQPRTAILGRFDGHSRVIMAPAGKATFTGFSAINTYKSWQWVELSAGLVSVNGSGSAPPRDPTWLSHLHDDCCHEFSLDANLATLVKVQLTTGTLACTTDHDRVDTIWTVETEAGLVITAPNGTVKFSAAAEAVIGNIETTILTGATGMGGAGHYRHYYELGTGNCSEVPIKNSSRPCSAHTSCKHPAPSVIQFNNAHIEGTDIDCSNSHYP